jgi:hypothetical protein
MFEREKTSIWVRVLLSFVLLAVLVGGGYAVYRLGYTQGAIATEAGDLAISEWHENPVVGRGYYHPYARGFFPLGSFFFGLLFLWLVFGLFRRIVFGPRWARWAYGWGPHQGKRGDKYGPRGYCGPHGHRWHHGWGPEEGEEQDSEESPEEDKST